PLTWKLVGADGDTARRCHPRKLSCLSVFVPDARSRWFVTPFLPTVACPLNLLDLCVWPGVCNGPQSSHTRSFYTGNERGCESAIRRHLIPSPLTALSWRRISEGLSGQGDEGQRRTGPRS